MVVGNSNLMRCGEKLQAEILQRLQKDWRSRLQETWRGKKRDKDRGKIGGKLKKIKVTLPDCDVFSAACLPLQ